MPPAASQPGSAQSGGFARPPRVRFAQRLANWARQVAAWVREGEFAATAGEELPRTFLLFLGVFGVGMILISLVGDQGVIAYKGLSRERSELQVEVNRLQQREQELHWQIEGLRSDPTYIEQLARQRLGLVRPGERILRVDPTTHTLRLAPEGPSSAATEQARALR